MAVGQPDEITVLYVAAESNPVTRVAAGLERVDSRISVRTVTDARAALDRLADSEIDCVVAEYDESNGTDIEFLETIRTDYPDLPFVLATDGVSEGVTREAIDAGATDVFHDGDDSDQYLLLANRIANAVQQYRTREANATDRHRTLEQELRQFREIVERSPNTVYVTDTDGTIEYVNPAFEEVTGYTASEAIGRTPRILKSGEHDEQYYEEFWEAILSGQEWDAEMIDERADGERVVLDQSITPITDENGDPQWFVSVARDITQIKADREELERARNELRRIIDLVPDLIFAKNRAGEYLLANEATADAYGLSPAEVEGKREAEIIPDVEDSEQFREDDIEVIESGESKVIPEEELTTADGETRIYQTTKIPYEVPGTDEIAVLGYGRDVTELKEYEQELESQRDNLELLNQIVRHDIRNDLQIVSAYAEQLEQTLDDEHGYAAKILEASRDAVEITETARDVTEVMLKSDTDLAPVNLRYVLEGEIDAVRSNHGHALITVEGSVPKVDVVADDMLESVFRNLLGNAIQHNDKELPEVTVSVRVEDATVRVTIADNGPGIPDDRKPAIFEEGEHGLDSSGTGLGLYLVETLIERYGGNVSVSDNDPEGAVFTVTLRKAR